MRVKLKTIWKDPVFSTLIAVAILSTITFFFSLITSNIEKSTFKTEMLRFWTTKIELWQIAFVFLFVTITYSLIRKQIGFKYDVDTGKLDKSLFARIREIYLTEDMMLSPKNNSYSSSPFLGDSLYRLFDILEESKKSEFEFLNPILEKKKLLLINEISNLEEITSKYIFGTRNLDWFSIPREWAHEQRDRFDEAHKVLKSQEDILTEKYDDFIKTGRRLLKI